MVKKCTRRTIITICSLALIPMSVFAAEPSPLISDDADVQAQHDEFQDARTHIDKSVAVLHQMETNPQIKSILEHSKGIFIVPQYRRVAVGVGARGGAGVLFLKRGSVWGDNPTFYNIGGISIGAQAGIEEGKIALILKSEKAINSFRHDNNFSLNADAGLTIVNWSKQVQDSTGREDIVFWADTKGLLGAVAVGVTDIKFDKDETGAYYRQKIADAMNVIDGNIKNPQAHELQQALATPINKNR